MVEYVAAPENDEDGRTTTDSMWDDGDMSGHDYDHDRYPLWRDWRQNVTGNARRRAAIERMEACRALEFPGADDGDVPYPRG